MRTKISKIAKDLNVGVNTAVEFLRKHNIEVDTNPNSRVDDAAVSLLTREFSSDKADKAQSDQRTTTRLENRNKARNERRPDDNAGSGVAGLKVLGKIDLSAIEGGSSHHSRDRQGRGQQKQGSSRGDRRQDRDERRRDRDSRQGHSQEAPRKPAPADAPAQAPAAKPAAQQAPAQERETF